MGSQEATGSLPIFPFFTGCARSGTTLVRAIFSSHPDMAIPDETHYFSQMIDTRARYDSAQGFANETFLADLLAHPKFPQWILPEDQVRHALNSPPAFSYAAAVRRVYALYAQIKGKPRYGDKTPYNVIKISDLAAVFPEARFIHLIRDGRDVALSLMDHRWGDAGMVKAARFWKDRTRRGRDAGHRLGPNRYIEIRYEDLVQDAENVVKSVCAFIQLEFDPVMLRYHETSERRLFDGRPGRPQVSETSHLNLPPTKGLRDWRTQMPADHLALFEVVAGDLLEELGYERGTDRPSLRIRVNAAYQRARAAGDVVADRLLRRTRLAAR
jgi:Sulfotransferase family